MQTCRPTRYLTRPSLSMGALTATVCLALCLAPVGAGARGSTCASRSVTHRLVHQVAPPQSFLSSLSVLRRPQTPGDLQGLQANGLGVNELLKGTVPLEVSTPSVIYADYIRNLGSVGGEPEYVVPARVQTVAPMSRRCLRRLSVKARRQQLKLERADRARGVMLLFGNSLFLLSAQTYSELINYPPWLVTGGEPPAILGEPHEVKAPASPQPDFVYGIVPDGVASVALIPEKKPPITAQVTINFFLIEVPPSFRHRTATVIRRDASGHTLKGRTEGPLP